jgi:hypothetical protein
MGGTRPGRKQAFRFGASIFNFLCDTTCPNIAYAIGKKQGGPIHYVDQRINS